MGGERRADAQDAELVSREASVEKTTFEGGRPIAAPTLTNDRLAQLHQSMLLIRAAEERAGSLFANGEIPGFIHLSIGQEAVPVGITAALRASDTVASTHRGHGHALAKGLPLDRFFLELMGKAEGICAGLGGSIHVADLSVGMLGANGIVGGGLPLAVGSALAHRLSRKGNVAVAYFGDGAVAEGAFHECFNLAALWRLPVLFACENNGWAEFTPSRQQIAFGLEGFAAAFSVEYARLDGNDVEAVRDAAAEAVEAMRADSKPRLLELMTHRVGGHFEGDPQKYRAGESEAPAPDGDPLVRSRVRLRELGYIEGALDEMANFARLKVEDAVARARQGTAPVIDDALAMVYTLRRAEGAHA